MRRLRVAAALLAALAVPARAAAGEPPPPPAGSRSAAPAGAGLLLTDELQLSVARAFLADGEPYRAVTEFKRLLILFPGSPLAAEARLGVAAAHAQGEEHADAARAYAAARAHDPGGPRVAEAWLLEGASWRQAGDPGRARAAFEALRAALPRAPEAVRAGEALALVDVEEGDLRGAAARLADLERAAAGRADPEAAERARRGAAVLAAAGDGRERSPALAGWLSAVVPGSGYLTVGRGGDAVTALAVNGLLVAGAVTAWRQENYPLAALAAGVWIPFYAGGIRGSANAVRRWNLALRADARARLAAALGFAF